MAGTFPSPVAAIALASIAKTFSDVTEDLVALLLIRRSHNVSPSMVSVTTHLMLAKNC
jgi:hypothetical protein